MIMNTGIQRNEECERKYKILNIKYPMLKVKGGRNEE
jgi:hypothetical protein